MTVWEDISLHIHKIVSRVLTIPFVELCPNRRHPPLQSFLPHILKHTPARGYRLPSFIIGRKNKFHKNDKMTAQETGTGALRPPITTA